MKNITPKTVSAVGCIHGQLPKYTKIKPSDFFVVVGDIMPTVDHSIAYQKDWFYRKFVPWLSEVPCKNKLFCAGNHDFWLQSVESTELQKTLPANCHYLMDEFLEIDGVNFFGTPWVSGLGRWAFNKDPEILEVHLREKLSAFEKKIDVFFAHSAPKILDLGKSLDKRVWLPDDETGLWKKETPDYGNEAIAKIIYEFAPKLSLHSHIHSGDHLGTQVNGGKTFVCNVAYLNEEYFPKYDIRQFTCV